MTNDKKLHRKALIAQSAVGICQNIEIFLPRYPANVKQANLTVSGAKFFPKSGLASRRSEELGIETARKNFKFCRIEAALDPALSILFGINENGVELTIKPMHVPPRHAFQEAVLGQNPDVLREVRMVNAARLQVEHFGREERSQPDRPWRADDNLGKFFPLYVIEHL